MISPLSGSRALRTKALQNNGSPLDDKSRIVSYIQTRRVLEVYVEKPVAASAVKVVVFGIQVRVVEHRTRTFHDAQQISPGKLSQRIVHRGAGQLRQLAPGALEDILRREVLVPPHIKSSPNSTSLRRSP